MMKQIILITDGCSNVGISPVIAAAEAHAEGIAVNVIGVVDQGELGLLGSEEIREIASAGGGISRIVNTQQLSQTVQMMTRKTVSQTVQQAVGKELQQILGHKQLEHLPPIQRAEVVHVIDDMSERSSLRVALLIDASGSMKPKIPAVREAIRDLLLSLRARVGTSELAVFHFPSTKKGEDELEMDLNWTDQLANLDKMFYKINMKGTTPTGPALLRTVHFVAEKPPLHPTKDGMLIDYVV
jgi:Ca-activated chloride channel family protein